MKPFVVLLGTAAFLGFSWVSWSSLRGPIQNHLTTTAQTALNEAGLDDVQIKFDHLDGVVSGVQTTAMETKVREIVLSTIPTGRLIFERPESDGTNSTPELNVDPNAITSEIAATETADDATNETPTTPPDTLAEPSDDSALSTVAQLETLESHDNSDETSRFIDAITEPETAPETIGAILSTDELAADTSSDYPVDIEDLASNDEFESLRASSDSDPEEAVEILAGDGSVDAPEIRSIPTVDDTTTAQSTSEESGASIGTETLTIDAPANPLSLNEPTADTDIASWEYNEGADSTTDITGDPDTATELNEDSTKLKNGLEDPVDTESKQDSSVLEILDPTPPAVEENNYASQLLNQASATNEEATENEEANNSVEPLALQPSDEESISNLEADSVEPSLEPADEATLSDANLEEGDAQADAQANVDAEATTDVDANVTANEQIPLNSTVEVTEDASSEVTATETTPLEEATPTLTTADEAQPQTQLEQLGDELPTIEPPGTNSTTEANSTTESNSTTATGPDTNSALDADSAPMRPKGRQPRFGVYLSNNPNDQLVRVVAPGSAAANADIRVGDSIVRFGLRNVSSFEDLSRAVMEKAGGDEVPVWVMRKGELLRKLVKLQSASAPLPPVRAPTTRTWNTRKQ